MTKCYDNLNIKTSKNVSERSLIYEYFILIKKICQYPYNHSTNIDSEVSGYVVNHKIK